MKRTIALLAIATLAGCATPFGAGTNPPAGALSCEHYKAAVYGEADRVIMNQDDTKKGAASTNDVVVSCGEATVQIKATASVPVPPGATTTTTTVVTPAK